MKISFSSDDLEALCGDERQLKRRYGAIQAKKILARLVDLRVNEKLADMRNLPGRCHELKGDRQGELALDLEQPYRLIFVPDHDPIPTKADSGLDWNQVTAVKIVEIVDYHD